MQNLDSDAKNRGTFAPSLINGRGQDPTPVGVVARHGEFILNFRYFPFLFQYGNYELERLAGVGSI